MIRCYVNIQNKVKEAGLDKINSKSFYYIDVYNPSLEELRELSKKFNLSVHSIKHSLDLEEIPRFETRDKQDLIIFRAPIYVHGVTRTTTLGVLINKKYMITIHRENIKSLNTFIQDINDSDAFKKSNSSLLVYELLDEVVKEFSSFLDKLGDDVEYLDSRLLEDSNKENVKDIFSAKRVLLYFRKALNGNRDVISSLHKKDIIFNDLLIEIMQIISVSELYRDRLAESMNIYLSSVSNKLNEIMKSFTIIASVLLLPMLVSGVYGMNFLVLPLAKHSYGFWIMLGVMLVSVLLMLLFFRMKKLV